MSDVEYTGSWISFGAYEWKIDVANWPDSGLCTHLKVRKKSGKDGITWDTLQKLKNRIFGITARAIEVYPSEEDLVNTANIRHLYIVPEDVKIPNLNI